MTLKFILFFVFLYLISWQFILKIYPISKPGEKDPYSTKRWILMFLINILCAQISSYFFGDDYAKKLLNDEQKEINKNLNLDTKEINLKNEIFISSENVRYFFINENLKIGFSDELAAPVYCSYIEKIKENVDFKRDEKRELVFLDLRNKKIEISNIPSMTLLLNNDVLSNYKFIKNEDKTDKFDWNFKYIIENENYNIEKIFTLNENNYPLNIKVKIEVKDSTEDKNNNLQIVLNSNSFLNKNYSQFDSVIYSENKNVKKINQKNKEKVFFDYDYFVNQNEIFVEIMKTDLLKNDFIRAYSLNIKDENNKEKIVIINESKKFNLETEVQFNWYAGARKKDQIDLIKDKNVARFFEYGIISKLSLFFSKLIEKINLKIGNMGISIILLILLTQLLFFPFFYLSKGSAKRKKEFERRYRTIEAKYANDPQRKALEQSELIKKYGFSTLFGGAGFIFTILQIPVILAVRNAVKDIAIFSQAPFILWMNNINMPDKYMILPFIFVFAIYFSSVKKFENPIHKFILLFVCVLLFFLLYKCTIATLLFTLVIMSTSILQRFLIES